MNGPSPRVLNAFLSAPKLRSARDEHVSPHAWHELVHLVRGNYAVTTPVGRLALTPGTQAVIPAGTVHQPLITRDGRTAYYLVQWFGACPCPPLQRLADPSGRIALALDWIAERRDQRELTQASQRQCDHLLAVVLAELERNGDDGVRDALDRTRHFMDEHLHFAALRLDDLARRAGLSRSRFSAVFAARYGQAPMSYLRERRLATARRMIAAGIGTYAEIGQRVGIPDPDYLSRLLAR